MIKKKKKKYTKKLTFKNSRFLFILKVIARFFKGKPSCIYSGGWHLITGPTGEGKTLLMNIIISVILNKGGFGWANIDEFYNKNVHTFDLEKMFSNGKQNFRLNKEFEKDGYKKHCRFVVIDELNRKFNRRMNRSSDYNDIFIPMIAWMVTIRHQLCDKGYLIGQSMLLQDGQIQSIIKWRHDVRSSKNWKYYFFREENKMLFLPKKLILTNYKNVDTDNLGNIVWKESKRKLKIRVYPQDFLSFDTHAFEKEFSSLPLYE